MKVKNLKTLNENYEGFSKEEIDEIKRLKKITEGLIVYQDTATGNQYVWDGTKYVDYDEWMKKMKQKSKGKDSGDKGKKDKNKGDPGDPGEPDEPGDEPGKDDGQSGNSRGDKRPEGNVKKDTGPKGIGDKLDADELAKQDAEAEQKIKDEIANGSKEASLDDEETMKAKIDKFQGKISDKEFQKQLGDEDKKVVAASKYNKARKEAEKAAQKAKKEASRISWKNLQGKDQFKKDLLKLVREQIEEAESERDTEDTYAKRHKWNDELSKYGAVMPGRRDLDFEAPIINVYFDCSGSWSERDHKLGQQIINELKKYEEDGELKIYTFYFANDVTTHNPHGGGTMGMPIINHIKGQRPKPKNIIIMTDSDISDCYESVTVEGGAMFIFLDSASQNIYDHVNGKQLKRAYALTR